MTVADYDAFARAYARENETSLFNAYYERRLTLSELSSYTGVRVQHLPKVEREAFGMSRVPGAA